RWHRLHNDEASEKCGWFVAAGDRAKSGEAGLRCRAARWDRLHGGQSNEFRWRFVAAGDSIKKILAPLGVGVAHHAHDVAAGMQAEGTRLAHRLHPYLVRQVIALGAVARMAAGNQVLPTRRASARARDNVVEREIR